MDHKVEFPDGTLKNVVFTESAFPQVEEVFSRLSSEGAKKNSFDKHELVGKTLLRFIEEAKEPCFLFPLVIDFISRVRKNFLPSYKLLSFEFWLNHYAKISDEENLLVRSKIAGKRLQRKEYQSLFPIGSGETFTGSHFVLAHHSPDVDATVASHVGFLDAFAARVGTDLSHWVVPGGEPDAPAEISRIFYQPYGDNVFEICAVKKQAVALSSMDVMTQRHIVKKSPKDKSYGVEVERAERAIVIVNKQGEYLGDWRPIDVGSVRAIVNGITSCLRWLENSLHIHLVALFARSDLHSDMVSEYLHTALNTPFCECDPIGELSRDQKAYLELFAKEVLEIKEGISCSFGQFALAFGPHGVDGFSKLQDLLLGEKMQSLFGKDGRVVEDRYKLFSHLENVFGEAQTLFKEFRDTLDSLGMALMIKSKVLGLRPHFVSHMADVEEIRKDIYGYDHLTVVYEEEGKRYPMGVIFANDVRASSIATLSKRDFSNTREASYPDYVEPISYIDHHASEFQTTRASRIVIADAQSSNCLLAEIAFAINDKFSTGNLTQETVNLQLDKLKDDLTTPSNIRLFRRLLLRKQAFESKPQSAWIDTDREFIEYYQFIYAIFDDTDLLTKMTQMDVDIVCSLVNRLASFAKQEEVEVVSLDDIPRDQNYVKTASKRLLSTQTVYDLYGPLCKDKEELINQTIRACDSRETLFQDTKLLHSYANVGQFKMFHANAKEFFLNKKKIQEIWVRRSEALHGQKGAIDFFLFMVSTIASAEELYQDKRHDYTYKDEIWCHVPKDKLAAYHLRSFLQDFLASDKLKGQKLSFELYGPDHKKWGELLEDILPGKVNVAKEDPKSTFSMLIVQVEVMSVKSRKSDITPYLINSANKD